MTARWIHFHGPEIVMENHSQQTTADLSVVILAGGAGTRFWPLSTEECPKQFLRLVGERSMLQQSYDRIAGRIPRERVLVLTSDRYVPIVREHLPELPQENIIGEPMRRDTSAAIALAALLVKHRFGDGIMAIVTSDHHIGPREAFQRSLFAAVRGARENPSALYTLGIPPTRPATAYGYLERGERQEDLDGVGHFRLERFHEKPDERTAQSYVGAGSFYWNSGMFVWSVDAILDELDRQIPEHRQHLGKAMAADRTPDWPKALAEAFEPLRKVSIDFGVMENARDVRCIETDFQWSDLGGWLALAPFLEEDDAGNSARGELVVRDAAKNIVFCADTDEQVVLLGVSDLVVVRTGNRTLVVPRARAEEIKQLVASLDPSLR